MWLSRKVPYRDALGRVIGLLGISSDITQRKQSESLLLRSEERFRSVVESLSEGLMIFDAQGNLIYQNPASLRIHGFGAEENGRLGRDQVPVTWEAWNEEGRPIAFDEWPISRVFRHELFQGQILHVRRLDSGHEFYASYNGSPIYDEDRKLALAFITIRDISEEVRAQTALRESEDIARASLDAALLGTWRHDLETDHMEFDARAAQHHGLSDGRATLQEMLGHVHPEDVHRVRAALGQASPSTEIDRYTLEYRTLLPDGRTLWVAMQANLRCQGEGPDRRPIGHFGTSQDITDRRQAARALEEANSRLREADQRKNDFLAALSHELRNPLSPIRSSVYLLERTAANDERTRRALAVIDRQAGHMARLVDDLLEVTRISRGKIQLQRKVIDVAAIAQETAEDHLDVFTVAGVDFVQEITASPIWVDADPTRIAQIIGNLLSNAAKFTPRGGRAVLRVGVESAWAAIQVEDSGAGMTRETLAHLFEPFSQASQTLDRSRGGLGLGLALVRGLVELHKGSVHAWSAGETRGSQLTVRLPVTAAPNVHGVVEDQLQRPVRALRILIIEDNIDAAATLHDVLELVGHHVVAVAHDGRHGVQASRAHQPDVVLCDIGLPELDGFSVAKALRADPDEQVHSAFLVALSGYALPEDLSKTTAAGFDAHMAKPANLGDLEKLLSQAPLRTRHTS